MSSATGYSVNEEGERVVAASRRPDGTIRKERRVRAGYIAQDEMAVYQSRGSQFKQGMPKCPGAADDDVAAAKAKSKAAAKNAKRKEKRQAETATAGMQSLSLGGSSSRGDDGASAAAAAAPPGAAPAPALEAAAEPAEPAGPEKQLRALRKKIRQAEQLAAKRAEGKELTEEEAAKLGRLQGWQAEATALEAVVGVGAA